MKNEYRKMKSLLMEEISEKELSPKQKAIAKLDPPADKIDAGDFAALRAGEKPKSEGEDHEVSMANNSIETIIKSAMELKAKLGNDEKDIPAWIQDHITNAENFITQAAQNYHEYGDHQAEDVPVDGALEKAIDENIEINIPEDTSYEALAKAVAGILKKDYGSHNFEPFVSALKAELGKEDELSLEKIMEKIVKHGHK
jgi:hypothetical protein